MGRRRQTNVERRPNLENVLHEAAPHKRDEEAALLFLLSRFYDETSTPRAIVGNLEREHLVIFVFSRARTGASELNINGVVALRQILGTVGSRCRRRVTPPAPAHF